ncbi:cytochrome P450 4C1-like [Daphnia carinata]|uniref:cytochrome P450 4C1-like n=1 Tax=Daphnia carinata TaxID=120202 RepID=UPI002579A8C7|nr:cytochrome P450 4C1-like [Daphnia carinata]
MSWLVSLIVRSLLNAYRFSVLIRQLPQGPQPLPIVGNALSFQGKYDYILRLLQVDWPRDYGEIYCVYMGPMCYVSISSPELLESILKSQKLLDKGETYRFFSPWLGDGLLLSTGAKWKMRRRLLTPAFHFQILNSFIDVFNNESQILCDLLDKRIGNGDEIAELNIYPFIANCTLDIVCETSMGVSVKAQSRSSDYVTALYRIIQILMERFAKPWLAINVIFYISKQGREHRRLLTTLHSFTRNVIKQRRQSFEKNQAQFIDDGEIKPKGNRRALLDLLLAVEADENNAGLSDQDIQEEIDTFMFEGHDTTTSAICWFLYCMATNPECQENVWTELRDVFGESDRPCSQQDLSDLTYLECCIKEAMRMYSPVPHIERHVKEDFKIGDYLIPSGSDIILLLYGLHHNPRLYPNPCKYDPERFLPDRIEGHHPYSYIPFSAGPRNCIGQRFALMEIKIVVSTFLRRFRVASPPTAAEPIPSMQGVLKPINGITLQVYRR